MIQYAGLHVKVIGYDVIVVDTHTDRMEVLLYWSEQMKGIVGLLSAILIPDC